MDLINKLRTILKKLRLFILIFWIAPGILLLYFKIVISLLLPKEEVPIDLQIKDLINAFEIDKYKYERTINVIKQIEDSCTIVIQGTISQKVPPHLLYYQSEWPHSQPINRKYPSFDVRMNKIWKNNPIGGRFNQKYVTIGICGNNACADLLYTTIPKDEFISHFRDSMEYCVYPEIPKSTEHWIVKYEDDWYLYDGYFIMDGK